MPSPWPHRIATDSDIDHYSSYVSKLAAIASPGDPAPDPFRAWFLRTHQALPVDETIAAPPTAHAA